MYTSPSFSLASERVQGDINGIDPERGPYLHIQAIGRLGAELLEEQDPQSP